MGKLDNDMILATTAYSHPCPWEDSKLHYKTRKILEMTPMSDFCNINNK